MVMRVFIADDSELMRKRLQDLLQKVKGAELAGQAEECGEAKEMIGKLQPDVVILDIRMPGGSGIDVLKTIKAEEKSPLVIILTNYAYSQYENKCRDLGADYFYDKSMDFRVLGEELTLLAEKFS